MVRAKSRREECRRKDHRTKPPITGKEGGAQIRPLYDAAVDESASRTWKRNDGRCGQIITDPGNTRRPLYSVFLQVGAGTKEGSRLIEAERTGVSYVRECAKRARVQDKCDKSKKAKPGCSGGMRRGATENAREARACSACAELVHSKAPSTSRETRETLQVASPLPRVQVVGQAFRHSGQRCVCAGFVARAVLCRLGVPRWLALRNVCGRLTLLFTRSIQFPPGAGFVDKCARDVSRYTRQCLASKGCRASPPARRSACPASSTPTNEVVRRLLCSPSSPAHRGILASTEGFRGPEDLAAWPPRRPAAAGDVPSQSARSGLIGCESGSCAVCPSPLCPSPRGSALASIPLSGAGAPTPPRPP